MAVTMTLANMVVRLTSDATKYDKGVDDARTKTKKLGKDFSQEIGLASKLGFAAAGVAATKFAVDAAKDFMAFDDAAREVFTLMPGMSQEAMAMMRKDILDYSTDVGRTTDEVIPSLYQAISAGVPPENVFDFLQTAHKAALGGVTDLETAVDGITSVINAYGTDVLSATEASDLMFTAVKLGKTDFDQLSKSLFQVIPTAAATGVNFGDITAALAAMTAQGTPTSVATTQLRQVLVELNKEGGKTADAFYKVTNVTFREFIAQGGNLQGALQVLEGSAADSNLQISDLFGSVEAGNAALALTGGGTETFTRNLEEMESAAGSTAEAAETMGDSGVRSMERFEAASEALKIELGEGLAPAMAEAAEAAVGLLSQLRMSTAIEDAKDQLIDAGLAGRDLTKVWGGLGVEFGMAVDVFTGKTENHERALLRSTAAVDALAAGHEAGSAGFYNYIDSVERSSTAIAENATVLEDLEGEIAAAAEADQVLTQYYDELTVSIEGNTEVLGPSTEALRERGHQDYLNRQAGYAYIEMLEDRGEAVQELSELAAESAEEEAAAAELAKKAQLDRLEAISQKLAGDFTNAIEPAIDDTDEFGLQLYNAAAAAGASTAELGLLGIGLGLFDQAAANSALQTALVKAKVDELAQAYIDGEISAHEMRGELEDYIGSLEDLFDPANDAAGALGDINEEAGIFIDGSPYEAAFDADTEDALTAIGVINTEADNAARTRTVHYETTWSGPPPGSAPGDGVYSYQHGADFMVPPGFPNDSFGPIFVSTGEHVLVETASQQREGGDGPQVVYKLVANYVYQDERTLKDDIRTLTMLHKNRV